MDERIYFPNIGRVRFFNFSDKRQSGKSLNFQEKSDLSGICQHGAEQIVECYGAYVGWISSATVVECCQECECFLGTKKSMNTKLISAPWFILCRPGVCDRNQPKSFVYFISDGEYTKIGLADNVEKRLMELQVGNARSLKITCKIPVDSRENARNLEIYLHNIYADYVMNGEWYNLKSVINEPLFTKTFPV